MLFFNESDSIIDRGFIHFFIPYGKYKGGGSVRLTNVMLCFTSLTVWCRFCKV